MNNHYDDILYLPHHVSAKHPQMSLSNRAAQFSPFAALTGYEGQIASAGYRRCNRIVLSEEEESGINQTLSLLKRQDTVSVTYFYSDPGTNGSGGFAEGEYRVITGEIRNILPSCQKLRIRDGNGETEIDFSEIIRLRKED